MKTKIITGIALFLVFLALAWADIFWLNFLIFGVILLLGFWESLRLFSIENPLLLGVAGIFYFALPFISSPEKPFFGAVAVIFLSVTAVASYLAWKKSENLREILPFLYPFTPCVLMFSLYADFGVLHLFWLIFIVILSDSGAYFVGKSIGKHGFSASSPNKTLEGVIGGLVLAVFGGYIFGICAFSEYSSGFLLLASFLSAFFGVFGDLFESYLKRAAGVKDSGNLLPGHGGVLDRIDGYMFAIIPMSVLLLW